MRFLVLALCFCAWLSSACGGGPDATPVPRYAFAPNVVLITIDTLRADHLSCYGHVRPTSPSIDALASEGLLFARACSTSGTTLPSHLSMFTGLLPHQHGHTSNRGAMEGPYVPADGREPVAKFFGEAGYLTAAFVSGNTVKRATGAHHGFEVWDQPSTLHRKGQDTRELVVDWLEERRSDPSQPFFLWVHFWDVHEPNDPPEPWRSMFQADEKIEALVAKRHVDAARLQAKFPPRELARMFYPELVEPMLSGVPVQVPPIDASSILRLMDVYDGSIRYVDDQVGAIVETIRGLGLWDRTIVALAGDHGQALGQHDWLEHGEIQGEQVHVPMVLRFPGGIAGPPARLDRVVSTIDLMPTIVGRIQGAPFRAFERQAAGSDLLDPGFDRTWAFAQRTDREREWARGRKYAVTMQRWKYYHLEQGEDELYDLAADPLELVDVAAQHPETVRELGELVERVLATNPANGSTRGTHTDAERDELERELRQSGYIGNEEGDDENSGEDGAAASGAPDASGASAGGE